MPTSPATASATSPTKARMCQASRFWLCLTLGVMLLGHAEISLPQPAIPERALKALEVGKRQVERQRYKAAIAAFTKAIVIHYTDKNDSRLDWAEQKIAALSKQ